MIGNRNIPNMPRIDLGVSENSVPLKPMVLLIIIPFLNGYFIGNTNPTFSDKAISMELDILNIT